ncbi:hypothetical protein CC80DRAFT_497114 [Byssothecium circinans]|uniref:Telomere replication protein EST3 n=1 Tax=Byssothecium circinans TaxID=147558 RepID=A0A6A5TLQ4_9PLEO|nr:hypothetical protein CC80DRAFT_497114 [Byssothecium circinans]
MAQTLPLTPWLVDNVSISLQLGRQWLQDKFIKKQDSPKSNPDRAWAGIYADDGSSLDIFEEARPDHGGNLQIVQQDPLTLTDGRATIVARHSRNLLKDLAEPNAPRTSPAPLNTVIHIRKYTVRYTAYGPPREKVTLILDQANWHGEARRRDSKRLKHITDFSLVASALEDLQVTRTLNDRRCFRSATPADDDTMAGGRVEEGLDRPSSPNTQMAYGTQMVHRPYEEEGVQHAGMDRGGLQKKATGFKEAQLLALLQKTRPAVPASAGFTRTTPPGKSPNTTKQAMAPQSPRAPGSARRSEQPRSASSPSRERGSDRTNIGTPRGQKRPHNAEIVAEQQSRPEKPEPVSSTAEDGLDDYEPDWLGGRPILNSARVPTRQRKLLDKDECWHKPRPGLRFPEGNVPIEILEAVKEQARSSGEGKPTASVESAPLEPSPSAISAQQFSGRDVEEAQEAERSSQISWPPSPGPRSPSPQPPKRPVPNDGILPPDSSLGDGNDALNAQKTPSPQRSEPQLPVVIESSNEHSNVELPSSPPVAVEPLEIAQDESDNDMELDVPRGLGESDSMPVPEHSHPAVVVQVEETPYPKGKNIIPKPAGLRQSPGGISKEIPSTAVIYGTYSDRNSPAVGDTVQKRANILSPPAKSQSAVTDVTPSKAPIQALPKDYVATFPDKDVTMKDALDVQGDRAESSDDLYSYPKPRKHSTGQPPSADRAPPVVVTDQEMHEIPLEPTPVSAQRLVPDLSSSGEQALPNVNDTGAAQVKVVKPNQPPPSIPDAHHLKRKLDNSPSKSSSRQTKRRELKIPDFQCTSPVKDIGAEQRRLKEESKKKFREGRQSDSNVAMRSTGTHDTLAGAEGREVFSSHAKAVHRAFLPVQSASGVHAATPQKQRDGERLTSEDGPASESSSVGTRKLQHLNITRKSGLDRQKGYSSDERRSSVSPITQALPSASRVDLRNHAGEDHELGRVQQVRESSAVSFSRPAASTSIPTPHQAQARSPASASMHTPAPDTVFQRFKATYPEYTADHRHFLGQCKQMYKLDQEDKMVPKWQWDDFIIRHRTDYRDYVIQCTDEGDDPEPYYRFYQDNIRNTLYTQGIVSNRKTLQIAIQELGAQPPPTNKPAPNPPSNSTPQPPRVKKPRKSYPWNLPPSNESATDRAKSTPRTSLPTTASHKGVSASSIALPPPPHRSPALSTATRSSATVGFATASATASSSRRTFNGSAFSQTPSGDPYRDYLAAASRVTSLTGDTRVRENIARVKRERRDGEGEGE